jgi:hypothetical protein
MPNARFSVSFLLLALRTHTAESLAKFVNEYFRLLERSEMPASRDLVVEIDKVFEILAGPAFR